MKTTKAIATKANIDKWDLIKEQKTKQNKNYHQNKQMTYRMQENVCHLYI